MTITGEFNNERRGSDRREGERRVTGERRLNSARHAAPDDMVFRSGRRQGDRRKFNRRQAA